MSGLATAAPSRWRAWVALVGLALRQQARARQMVWVSLGLLAITLTLIAVRTNAAGWSSARRSVRYGETSGRIYRFVPPPDEQNEIHSLDRPTETIRLTSLGAVITQMSQQAAIVPGGPEAAVQWAAASAMQTGLSATPVNNFTRAIMFSLFLGCLLPIWSLSFATEALGGERESRSLVWLLTKPIPRWAIYLGKYVAILPWTLAFNLGGFWLMCRIAGAPGKTAFALYWPAIAAGTFAFTSLFHFFAAATRRPTVVGLVYCIFLEAILGDMPGLLKRASVSYYVRCLIFDSAAGYGIAPDKPSVYLPVSGSVAWMALAGVTLGALVLGAIVFSRAEYRDDAA